LMHLLWLLLLIPACAHRLPEASEQRGFAPSAHYEEAPEFGGELYVVEAGARDAPPLLLIHGLGDKGTRDFDPILPDLTRRYRVLAFDLPGLARSSRRADIYSPARYAALIRAMARRHFGDRAVAVLGHSMGGAIALQFAANHPEQVERLMLFDVAGILHYREYMREVIAGSPKTAWQRLRYGTRETLFAIGMFPAQRMKLETLALEANATLRGFFSSSRTASLLFIQHDFGPAIRAVRAPTFIGWGKLDSVAPPRTAMILRSQLPVRQYVEFAKSGHVPMTTEPAAVSAAVHKFMSAAAYVERAPEHPALIARNGVCERRRDRLFEGDYDTIKIHRCKGVVLRHVRARQLVIDRSEAVLEDVQLDSPGTAATFRRSRLRWSGGRVSGEVCILADASEMDLGGVRCAFHGQSIRVLQPTRLLASVSALEKQGETRLHGEYELIRTQEGALEEMPVGDERRAEHSRSARAKEDLAGEWLVGEDFTGASLRGIDLTGARLDGAKLDGADLREAHIVSARLVQAQLRGANLVRAELHDSDLRHADLRGADLSDVMGLEDALLEHARFDGSTKFPVGFSPVAHRMRREPP
jgi:pimeloyl-ACP methyl ester carboxylesterase